MKFIKYIKSKIIALIIKYNNFRQTARLFYILRVLRDIIQYYEKIEKISILNPVNKHKLKLVIGYKLKIKQKQRKINKLLKNIDEE